MRTNKNILGRVFTGFNNEDLSLKRNNGMIPYFDGRFLFITKGNNNFEYKDLDSINPRSRVEKEVKEELIEKGYLIDYNEFEPISMMNFDNKNIKSRVEELIEVLTYSANVIEYNVEKFINPKGSMKRLVNMMIDRLIFETMRDVINVFKNMNFDDIRNSMIEREEITEELYGMVRRTEVELIQTHSQYKGRITNLVLSLPNMITLRTYLNSEESMIDDNSTFFSTLIENLVSNISLIISEALSPIVDENKRYLRDFEEDIVSPDKMVNIFQRPFNDYSLLPIDSIIDIAILYHSINKKNLEKDGLNEGSYCNFDYPITLTELLTSEDTNAPLYHHEFPSSYKRYSNVVKTIGEMKDFLNKFKCSIDARVNEFRRFDFYIDFNLNNKRDFNINKDLKIVSNSNMQFDYKSIDYSKFSKIIFNYTSLEKSLFSVYYNICCGYIDENQFLFENYTITQSQEERVEILIEAIQRLKDKFKCYSKIYPFFNELLSKFIKELTAKKYISFDNLIYNKDVRGMMTGINSDLRMYKIVPKDSILPIHKFISFVDSVTQGVSELSSKMTERLIYNPGFSSHNFKTYFNFFVKSRSLYASNMILLKDNNIIRKGLLVNEDIEIGIKSKEYKWLSGLLMKFLDYRIGSNSGINEFLYELRGGMFKFYPKSVKGDGQMNVDKVISPLSRKRKHMHSDMTIFLSCLKNMTSTNKEIFKNLIGEFVLVDNYEVNPSIGRNSSTKSKNIKQINEFKYNLKEYRKRLIEGKKMPLSFLMGELVLSVGRIVKAPLKKTSFPASQTWINTLSHPFLFAFNSPYVNHADVTFSNTNNEELFDIFNNSLIEIQRLFLEEVLNEDTEDKIMIHNSDEYCGSSLPEKIINKDVSEIDPECDSLLHSNKINNIDGLFLGSEITIKLLKLLKLTGLYDIEKRRILSYLNISYSLIKYQRDDNSYSNNENKSEKEEPYLDGFIATSAASFRYKEMIENKKLGSELNLDINNENSIINNKEITNKNDIVLLLIINSMNSIFSRLLYREESISNYKEFISRNYNSLVKSIKNLKPVFIRASRMNIEESSMIDIFLKYISLGLYYGIDISEEILTNLLSNKTNQFLISYNNFSFSLKRISHYERNIRSNRESLAASMDIRTILNSLKGLYEVGYVQTSNIMGIILLRLFKGDVERMYREIFAFNEDDRHSFCTLNYYLILDNDLKFKNHKLYEKFDRICKGKFDMKLFVKLVNIVYPIDDESIIELIPDSKREVEDFLNRNAIKSHVNNFLKLTHVDIETTKPLDKRIDLPEDWIYENETSEDKYSIHFHKANDLSVLDLGGETNCCQRLNGAASSCVIQGVLNPYAGFISYRKNGRIIAQSYIWTTPDDKTLVIDSVESRYTDYKEKLTDMINEYSKSIKYNIVIGGSYSKIEYSRLKDGTLYKSGLSPIKLSKYQHDENNNVNKLKFNNETITIKFLNSKKCKNSVVDIYDQVDGMENRLKEMSKVYKYYYGKDYSLSSNSLLDIIKTNADLFEGNRTVLVNSNTLIYCKVAIGDETTSTYVYTDAKEFYSVKK